MPKFLARNNKNNTPIAALITTNVQALLLTVLFVRDALDFMIALDTALFGPLSLRCGIRLKLTITRETYGAADESERRRQQIVAVAAVLYSIFLLYAAGLISCGQHRLRPWHLPLHLGPTGTGRARFPAARGRAVRSACGRCRRRNRPHLHRLPGTLILD